MSSLSFVQLLNALISSNNDVRKQAEQYYDHRLSHDFVGVVQDLVNALTNRSNGVIVRSFCGILMRRFVASAASQFTDELTSQIKISLVSLWEVEFEPVVLKKLSHIMAELASQCEWNELIPKILSNIENGQLLAVLNFIEIACEYCSEDITSHIGLLCNFLGSYISSSDVKVQVACARAICSCVEILDDDKTRNSFRPALSPILEILGAALSRGDEIDATAIMEKLVSIADIQPMFFKGCIDGVVNAMLIVAGAAGLEFSTRTMALELMVTLAETAPALARKCPALVQGLVPLSMLIMLEVEDEDETQWMRGKYTPEEDSLDDNYVLGDEAIERVAAGLGGRNVAPVVFPIIQQYSRSPDWRYRRAAIAALYRLAEGHPDSFKAYFNEALGFFANSITNDQSWRVKYESIQAVGRFAELYSSSIQVLVESFMPSLVLLLQDSTVCDRVRGHAASALINLTNPESCEEEILQPYIEPLLSALLVCLQSASYDVQVPCLTLLGSIAQTAKEAFMPFYPSFIPGFKSILRGATSPDLSIFRGKTMECVGLVADAVGPAVFANDAVEIMDILIQAMAEDKDNDCTFEYILPACTRISKSLGRHFEPYLAICMGPLLTGAVQDVHFAIEEAEDSDTVGEVIQDEDTGNDSTVVSFGAGIKKRITVNTHAAQQKNQAARMLYEFADSMKGYFHNYLTSTLQSLLPMLANDKKNVPDIRSSAALALAKVFYAYIDSSKLNLLPGGSAELEQVMLTVLSTLLQALSTEINATCRGCLAEALCECLTSCYTSGSETSDGKRCTFICAPDANISNEITNVLLKKCSESISRRISKEKSFDNNEGLEEEDKAIALSEFLEEEEDLLRQLVDGLGQLLKIHGEAYMSVFDASIAPHFAPFLSSNVAVALQISAICMIDDALEFGGASAAKYIAYCMPIFMNNVSSSDDLVLRQCSLYGIAQCARLDVSQFSGYLAAGIVPLLVRIVTDSAAGDSEYIGITDNALYALGVLLSSTEYRSQMAGFPIDEMSSLWLKGLPLRSDEVQAKVSSDFLCQMIEQNDVSNVLGAGGSYSHLSEVLRVIADTLYACNEVEKNTNGHAKVDADESTSYSLAFPATQLRMKVLVNGIISALPQDLIMQACHSLNPQQQQILQACQ